jgi:hypothetical protein
MRRYILILVAVIVVVPGMVLGTSYNLCREDHLPPPFEPALPDKIGEVAGFQILGMFLSLGGFGCDDQTLDTIRQMSEDYLEGEYTPRYDEAAAIHEWLNATHDVQDPDQFRTLAQQKITRLNEISAEIDAIWAERALDAWALIPVESRDAYLAWYEEVIGE